MKRRRLGVRLVLLAGFGGGLALMALAGLDSIRGAHRIEQSSARITSEYLGRHHWLERIRSDLYLSSAVTRDYLFERNPEAAQRDRARLSAIHTDMNAAMSQYEAILEKPEIALFSDLRRQVGSYWESLEPLQTWSAGERLARGSKFFDSEVLPRRALTMSIADKIDSVHEQALRAGSQRSAELFQQFRNRITAMLDLTLGLGALLAAVSIAYILRLEREASARYREALAAGEELKSLSARLVAAQEQERRVISRELHDEVGQTLSVLLVDIGNLGAVVNDPGGQGRALLTSMRKLAESSLHAIRNMALLLRPSMLDDLGLVPALEWQAREVSRRTGMRVQVAADDVADDLPEDHRTCIYRVVQEALHNSSQHASARNVRISVRQDAAGMLLDIQDDGRGFDAERVRGLGLLGMEERVEHLGGSFHIHSRTGTGTAIRVRLPLPGYQQTHAARAS